MNKKIILIFVGALVVLALIFLTRSKTLNNQNKETNTTQTTEEKTTVFGSIKDAMSKSLSLKCEYKNGETTIVAYIKGDSVRVDSLGGENNTGNVIMKDNKLWSWDDKEGEGIIMPLAQPTGEQKSGSEQIIADLEKEKQYCHTAVVADSMFIPPTNIKFQDLSDMLKEITGYVPAE